MRRIKREWVIVLLAILASAIWLYKSHNQKKELSQRSFSAENMENITSIRLSTSANSLTLNKEGNRWLVNGEVEVEGELFNDVYRALSHMSATAPVPLSVNDSLVAVAQGQGVEVSLYAGKKRIKQYSVIHTQTMQLGDVGVMHKSKTAYRLTLPALEGSTFELLRADPEYWIPNRIALIPAHQIEWVEVELPEDLDNSFRIDRTDSGYRLFNIYNGTFVTQFDTVKVDRFMQSISWVEYTEVQTLSLPVSPDYIITIQDNRGSVHKLKIYPIPVEPYEDELGRTVYYDANHLLITHQDDGQSYMVRFMDLFPFMRSLSYFLVE